MSALSMAAAPETRHDSGLPIDEIEARLFAAAKRHHLEERNIAYWLAEIDERGLHRERGFSSIGDYALELIGIKPRKAHYLVFIASRLQKLPQIREAFDSGELSWTKAREIASTATAETEGEWLDKARRLSNRDLERAVRRHAGQDSGGFATVTISMPVEVLEMWNDSYELAERLSGTALEKWQVLEPALAEFLGTHLPADASGGEVEVEDERALPVSVRNEVLNRDGWQCAFPGCTLRKMLDVHHIVFRSRGGSDDADNLICLCRTHHGLVHRGICSVTGSVGLDLKFERPRLVTENASAKSDAAVADRDEREAIEEPALFDDDESWRDEMVADIFDVSPAPKYEPPYKDYGDFIAAWAQKKQANEREDRSRRRRGGFVSGAHVCTEAGNSDSTSGCPEAVDYEGHDGPPGG
jgi:hypothetical protein